MADTFETYNPGLESPASRAADIVPNDATDLARPTRAIYVGASGDLAVLMTSGDAVTFTGIAGGVVYPIRVARVLATGTTATGLIALS